MRPTDAAADSSDALRERAAVQLLLARGGDALPAQPWLAPGQPPSSVDLVRHVVWRATAAAQGASPVEQSDLLAALNLLASARAEVEHLETGLLFVARTQGLTWAQIGQALGLRSPQAAQQRFDRLGSRAADQGQG